MMNNGAMRSKTSQLLVLTILVLCIPGCSEERTISSGKDSGEDLAQAVDLSPAPDKGPAAKKLKIVFIGNSLTFVNNLPLVLMNAAASAKPAWSIAAGKNHTPGASSLSSNWQSWSGSSRGTEALDLIQKVKPDIVVLQDQSSGPSVATYTELWHGWIQAAGARTVLFMTWGTGDMGGPVFKQSAGYLERIYNKAGQRNGVTVAPVGTAWQRHYAKSKQYLHSGDALHPAPHGTYLAAMVFFATLTGQNPKGLSSGGLNISTADRAALQQLAWETYSASPQADLSKQVKTPPKDDHANTPAGATSLTLGKPASGKLPMTDVDVFSFSMPRSGKLSLSIQGVGKVLDLMILDEKEKIIGRNNHASSKLTVADYYFKNLGESPTLKAGKYYLRVSGITPAASTVAATYTITSQAP